MAGAVFDVFCLLLGDGMSRTDLLPPIRALFESSSRGVLVPFGVGFAHEKTGTMRTLTDNGKIFAKNAAKFGIFWKNRVKLSSLNSLRVTHRDGAESLLTKDWNRRRNRCDRYHLALYRYRQRRIVFPRRAYFPI